MRKWLSFVHCEDGTTAAEYGLIASLIAVAIVTVLITLGPALSGALK